jgi:hypothetical protein
MDSTPEQGTPERFPQRFKPGNPGRKVGTTTKTTRLIREAILIAAELEGQDGKGKGKLIGYMRRMASEDMKAFAMLLGRVIPLQIETRTNEDKAEVTYHNVDDVRRELASRGISMEIALKVMRPDLVIDDLDPDNE